MKNLSLWWHQDKQVIPVIPAKQGSVHSFSFNPTLITMASAIILFIIPEREFNIGDQILIEQGLLSRENSSLLVKHVTFIDIYQYCFLDSNGILYL